MKPKDLDYIRDTVENEGFEYAFVHYSDFKEVKDEEFHKLRKAYADAYAALSEYLHIEE